MGPTNSPLPQQSNLQDFNPPMNAPKATPEELNYAKVGESEGWKQLKEFAEKRKENFKRYLPGGDSIANLKGTELEAWVKAAAIIMDEYDSLVAQVDAITDAVKQQK